LLRDALAEAIEEYGLDPARFSAEAWAALVAQFNKGLLNERLLGFDRGHADLLAAIDGWLATLQEGKPLLRRLTLGPGDACIAGAWT
jgi:hypothetical protein